MKNSLIILLLISAWILLVAGFRHRPTKEEIEAGRRVGGKPVEPVGIVAEIKRAFGIPLNPPGSLYPPGGIANTTKTDAQGRMK